MSDGPRLETRNTCNSRRGRVRPIGGRSCCSLSLQLVLEKGFLVAMRLIISTVIASVSFIASATFVAAQDPAVVQAKTVKVKFENERVRVLEAELPAGVKETVHSHPAYVIYVMAGGKVRNYAADGKTTESELKTGDVLYREPLTHAAENIGTTTMHFILVELKTPAR
jgi:quercetin dioxygenase-like cupin family protein